MRILTGDYLFNTPITAPSGYFLALTIGFGVLLLASVIVYWCRSKLAPDNPAMRRLLRRVAKAGIWTSVIGLILAAARYGGVDYVGMPIWILVLILIMIAIVGYFVYEVSERYPMAVLRLQQSHIERRYRPPTRQRAEPKAPRPKVRGKRRKR